MLPLVKFIDNCTHNPAITSIYCYDSQREFCCRWILSFLLWLSQVKIIYYLIFRPTFLVFVKSDIHKSQYNQIHQNIICDIKHHTVPM